MSFTQQMFDKISEDPLSSVIQICDAAMGRIEHSGDWTEDDYAMLLETYALLVVIDENDLLQLDTYKPDLTGNTNDDCSKIINYISTIRTSKSAEAKADQFEILKARFTKDIGKGFSYEFSSVDLSRIQTLINELRETLSESAMFEAPHQARLLARLEKLQAELHLRMSSLDKFWGLVGDAGVALGKFGTDAKPFVDRIVEISNIVWNTQARAEQLPSSTPMPLLSHHRASDDPSPQ